MKRRLDRAFFSRPTLEVARALLGKTLLREEDRDVTGGVIVETEAYIGEADDACHARAGRTPRTEVMYGPAGFAYVYLNYGLHWLFNIVTDEPDQPAAVLIRAIVPGMGIERIATRRGRRPEKLWTDGPGKLTQALGITGADNGADLCTLDACIFIQDAPEIPDSSVTRTPRVGLNKVSEPWKSAEWRFVWEN
ncbi:MAG TPA: DNA-3-methyladenine glycosylase [Anaerolineales bacterium]|nr:DNA-3-methyladenine glycosylase [Anaerolineales bacterium]